MVINMSLGEKIQQLRKAGSFSQEQLADNLNVSRQAISKWETDQSSPDIEKILAISTFFSISTDELLGSNVPDNAKTLMSQSAMTPKRLHAVNWIKAFTGFIDNKVVFMVFALLCFIGIGTCAIVNYAINEQITWAAYPIISILFGWLILAPVIFKKYALALCVLTVTVGPFLYFVDMVSPAYDWFFELGLPCAILGVVFFWVNYLLFRFAKISLWYKIGISLFFGGAVISPISNYFTDRFTGSKMAVFNLLTNIFSGVIILILFFIIGYMRKKTKAAASDASDAATSAEIAEASDGINIAD